MHSDESVSSHSQEILNGDRFQFGKNWNRFLRVMNNNRIEKAESSLKQMLEVEDLAGKRFLDIGSGSGIFSLAAHRLGARVHSFDYDPNSVACAKRLKENFSSHDEPWTITQGSVLDTNYMSTLGEFDFVYSWGVLHHTGQMRSALENAQLPVAPGGRLFISIYNYQGWRSAYWKVIKKAYNLNCLLRFAILLVHFPYLFAARFLARALSGRLTMDRGMSIWYDMLDWLGGYPFEVARPEEILEFYRSRGYSLEKMKTCSGRPGCNEFVFIKREIAKK